MVSHFRSYGGGRPRLGLSVLIGPSWVGYRSVSLPDEAGETIGVCRMSHRLPLAVLAQLTDVDFCAQICEQRRASPPRVVNRHVADSDLIASRGEAQVEGP